MAESLGNLFERYRLSGDPDALARVFDGCAPAILEVAIQLARDTAEAEDLVQATFLTAIESSGGYEAGRPLVPWLLGILANHARKLRRNDARSIPGDCVTAPMAVDTIRTVQGREFSRVVAESIEGLEEPYRSVLVFHLLHGMSSTEIGHALGRSPGTVRSQVARGMDCLRRTLPVGFAGAAAALGIPTRGLAAVRQHVLGVARAGRPFVLLGGLGMVGGLLVMKKFALLVGACALISLWCFHRSVARVQGSDAESSMALQPLEVTGPTTDFANAEDLEELTKTTKRTEIRAGTVGGLEVIVSRDSVLMEGIQISVSSSTGNVEIPVAATTTDREGAATFAGLPVGSVLVRTNRGDVRRAAVVGSVSSRLELRLSGELDVRVRVINADGQAVAGAKIICVSSSRSGALFEAGLCDRMGEALLRGVQTNARLWAEARGHRPSAWASLSDSKVTDREIQLVLGVPGRSLAGLVVDKSGRGVAHAQVGILLPGSKTVGSNQSYRTPTSELHRLKADADGRFKIDWAPKGELRLFACDALNACDVLNGSLGFASRRGTTVYTVNGDGQDEVRIEVRRRPSVYGVLRDAQGEPVVSAFVGANSCEKWGLEAEPFTAVGSVTGADGSFRFEGLLPGRYELQCWLQNNSVELVVDLEPESELRWDPILDRGSMHRVRLLSESGEPLVGWRVEWRRPTDSNDPQYHGSLGQSVGQAITDGTGRCHAAGLQSGVYTLVAFGPLCDDPQSFRDYSRLPSYVQQGVSLDQDESVLTVPATRLPSARIRARFVNSRGEPLSGVRVRLGRSDWSSVYEVEADPSTGRWDSGKLSPDVLSGSASCKGHSAVGLGELRLVHDQVLDLGDIEFADPASLAVRLTRADGQRVVGPHVLLAPSGGCGRECYFDLAAGKNVMRSMSAGEYDLYAYGVGLIPIKRSVTVRAGESLDLLIELVAGPEVEVELLFSKTDSGIANGLLHVLNEAGDTLVYERIFQNFEDLKRGLVRREFALPSGRYTIKASGAGGIEGERDFEVPAENAVGVELR